MSHLSSIRQLTAMKLKSLNDLHVTVCLRTYIQPKTIKIIYKIFTKFKDLSTLKIFTSVTCKYDLPFTLKIFQLHFVSAEIR